MTSLLEKIISIIAPHHCFLCSKESNILCSSCAAEVFADSFDACFLCNKPTAESSICQACRTQTGFDHVWVAGRYEGPVRQLIRKYKFERVRAGYYPLAQAMIDTLPYMEDVIVVHIPTVPSRIRTRGYDHARLLGRQIARSQRWRHEAVLRRRHSSRQVGASRAQRWSQAQRAFELALDRESIQGKHILLVDDVTTSGATLTAAAELLVRAGARVDAVVVAKQTLESP